MKSRISILTSIYFRFCTNHQPSFLVKMDDDTIIDYKSLEYLLDYEETHFKDEYNIYCPSVLRNQKLWTHKDAPIMGKWAYMNENYTDYSKFYRIKCMNHFNSKMQKSF